MEVEIKLTKTARGYITQHGRFRIVKNNDSSGWTLHDFYGRAEYEYKTLKESKESIVKIILEEL